MWLLAALAAFAMTDLLPTDPDEIEVQAVRRAVQNRVTEGRLPLESLAEHALQPRNWNIENYVQAIRNLAPTSGPRAPGAVDGAASWRDSLKEDLRSLEGHRSQTYSDAAKGDDAPTVGYGFNLASPVSRAAIKSALGFSDSQVQDLVSRKASLSQGQSERVLDHIITAGDAELSRALPGVTLNDPQRRSLLNLWFNSGLPALKSVGVLDAVASGDTAGVIKTILSWPAPKSKATGQPLDHVAKRRRLAAMTYAGGDLDRFRELFK